MLEHVDLVRDVPETTQVETYVAAQISTYGVGQQVNQPYAEAVARTKEALRAEGFGVLCEIDVQKTLKEKLGADFRPYVILGACNPPLAHQALEAELDLGLLLHCNVVAYATDHGSMVEAMDPKPVLGLVGNPVLTPIAREAKTRL